MSDMPAQIEDWLTSPIRQATRHQEVWRAPRVNRHGSAGSTYGGRSESSRPGCFSARLSFASHRRSRGDHRASSSTRRLCRAFRSRWQWWPSEIKGKSPPAVDEKASGTEEEKPVAQRTAQGQFDRASPLRSKEFGCRPPFYPRQRLAWRRRDHAPADVELASCNTALQRRSSSRSGGRANRAQRPEKLRRGAIWVL
jgi:hypothetical protein